MLDGMAVTGFGRHAGFAAACERERGRMDLSKPQENAYGEQVRQQRLRVKAAFDNLFPEPVFAQIRPTKPSSQRKRSAQRQPAAPTRQSQRIRGNAMEAAAPEPPCPISALVAVLRAGRDDWMSEEHVRGVASTLADQAVSAAQVEQGIPAEMLHDLGLKAGDILRIQACK